MDTLLGLIPILIVIGIVVLIVARMSGGHREMVCRACGTRTNSPHTTTRGSFVLELFLWLLFIIPGLIYSLWRVSSKYKACPSCGSRDLIPVDSPVGRRLIAENEKQA